MNTVKATAVYLLVLGLIIGWIYWAIVAGGQDGDYGRLVWLSPILLVLAATLFYYIVIVPIGWLAELFGGNK